MPVTVLNYADSATVVTPPDQWILNGQSDENPYLAAYHVWVAVETINLVAPMYDMYDSTGPGWFVNKITPYGYPTKLGTAVNDGIFLAAGAADTYGVQIQATEDRDIRLQVVDSGSATQHFWHWKRTGILAISGTKQVQGLLAGKEASTELRYGYGPTSAYPTFRYEFSPVSGGWASSGAPVTNAGGIGDSATPNRTVINGPVSPATVQFRTPVRIAGYDTTRATGKTFATVTGLYVTRLRVVGSATSTSVQLVSVDLTTGTKVTIFRAVTTSGTAADFSETTPSGGASGVLAYGLYDYYLEWECVAASTADGAEVARVYLEIEKRAVE